jgi:DNA-binding transcriptional LysR family regulator
VDLAAEGFDLAVRAGPVRDESLVARRIGNIDIGLYASSKYLARRGQPETIDDLTQHDCVVLRSPDRVVPWVLTSSNGEQRTVEPQGAIGADDVAFLKKAVLAGGGIAFLPRFVCYREEVAGKLVRVLPDWKIGGSLLNVVYPSARYVPQRDHALRDQLVNGLNRISKRCAEHATRAE